MSEDSSSVKNRYTLILKVTGVFGVIFLSFAVFFLSQIFAPVILGYIISAVTSTPTSEVFDSFNSNAFMQFLLVLVVQVAVIGLVAFLYHYTRQSFKKQFTSIDKTLLTIIAKAFGLYLLISLIATIFVDIFVPAVDLTQEQQIIFRGATGFGLLFAFLSLCVFVPIGEEVLFRGFLHKYMTRFSSVMFAGVVSSIFFGFAHLEFTSIENLNWAAGIDTLIFAFVLTWVYEKSGSLTAPILLHATKNILAFIILFVFVR